MDPKEILSSLSSGTSVGSYAIAGGIYLVYRLMDLLFHLFRNSMDKSIKIKGIVNRDEADDVISGLLDGAMGTTLMEGERVQVIEFTNTVKNVALVPFLFMTCTYESFSLGKRSMAHIIDNKPTSLCGMYIRKLQLQTLAVIDLDNRDMSLGGIYDLLEQRGATKNLALAIRSPLSKKMIGYISYDTNDAGDFSDAAITLLRNLSGQIGTLLTLGDW